MAAQAAQEPPNAPQELATLLPALEYLQRTALQPLILAGRAIGIDDLHVTDAFLSSQEAKESPNYWLWSPMLQVPSQAGARWPRISASGLHIPESHVPSEERRVSAMEVADTVQAANDIMSSAAASDELAMNQLLRGLELLDAFQPTSFGADGSRPSSSAAAARAAAAAARRDSITVSAATARDNAIVMLWRQGVHRLRVQLVAAAVAEAEANALRRSTAHSASVDLFGRSNSLTGNSQQLFNAVQLLTSLHPAAEGPAEPSLLMRAAQVANLAVLDKLAETEAQGKSNFKLMLPGLAVASGRCVASALLWR